MADAKVWVQGTQFSTSSGTRRGGENPSTNSHNDRRRGTLRHCLRCGPLAPWAPGSLALSGLFSGPVCRGTESGQDRPPVPPLQPSLPHSIPGEEEGREAEPGVLVLMLLAVPPLGSWKGGD